MRNGARPTPDTCAWRPRRMGAYLGVASLLAATLVMDAGVAAAQRSNRAPAAAEKGTVGWDTFRDVHGLTQLRGGEQSRQFSSFARDGSNDDGFEGTYSCLRTTNQGCVIAEHSGPGEITSMWFTREPYGDVTGTGNITVELDGQVVLDAPLIDVVNGRLGAPFVWPLVGNADDASGGAVVKVPMPYQESMRVTVENNPDFYHVSYRTFPDAQGVPTFDPSDPATDVIDRLRRFGIDDPKPADPAAVSERENVDLAPGQSAKVATLNGPAQINRLRVRMPQVVASPQVVDDGRAFGEGGGSQFRARIAPDNEGVRIIRRFDPQIADQVAEVRVEDQVVGEWRNGEAVSGQWGVQRIDVPGELTSGKSSITVANRYVSSSVDVNEFRYDVQSRVNGEWVRTDVLDLGPSHPGEEAAHGYQINNQVFERVKLVARYASDPDKVAESERLLEGARLRITFDGNTTVDAPIGEFFGSGLGEYDVRSLMSSIDAGSDGWYTAWWPMPFSRDATVELVNDSDVPISGATAEVTSAPQDVGPNTGYFHATHQRAETTDGADWNFLDVPGSGTFYGVTHSMRGLIPPYSGNGHPGEPLSSRQNQAQANQRNYLEGDERFYVNGSSSPVWHGTGSEDFYEAGWYFRDGTTFVMPLAGNPSHEYAADGCQYDCTGAYRLMLPDAVPFNNGLLAGIEHGPANDEPGDYSSTAYWYGGRPPSQQETDVVDLADPASREAHGYTAQGEQVEQLESAFEGSRDPEPFVRDTTTATGRISFDVRVGADNQGVRLRRLSDQVASYQQADVFVDGESAGRWTQPLGNQTFRWLEDTFELPASLTSGKERVHVELAPVPGSPPWSSSRYTAFAH